MRTHNDAKLMAEALRGALGRIDTDITHAQALEIVAAQFGVADWNVLAARIAAADPTAAITFTETCPILRIFDETRAREFYLGFLGFALDWEHRFGDSFPLYAQVSRAGLVLHLSGHHGDGTPGSTVFVRMRGIRDYHREITAPGYANMRPGVEHAPWGQVMEVIDPFGNHIRFCESPET